MKSGVAVIIVVYLVATLSLVNSGEILEGTLENAGISDKPFILKFKLTNNRDSAITILKWDTPFDKKIQNQFVSNFFTVVNGAKEIEYQGLLIRRDRRKAKSEDFLKIEARQHASVDIDLSKAYGLQKGDNTVNIDFDISVVTLNSKGAIETSYNFPLSGTLKVTLTEKEAEAIKKELGSPLLIETQAQLNDKLFKGKSSLRALTFQNCNNGYKTSLTTAVNRAVEAVNSATGYLDLNCVWDQRFHTWFGKEADGHRRKVKRSLESTVGYLPNAKIKCCDDDPSLCDGTTFAFVHRFGSEQGTLCPTNTICICNYYFTLGTAYDDDLGNQFGTLIHEVTHLKAQTKDHKYQGDDCKKLAASDPLKAVNNADSYLLFHMSDFPGQCIAPAAVENNCLVGETAYISSKIADCTKLYQLTYDASVTLKNVTNLANTITQRVRSSKVTAGLFWNPRADTLGPETGTQVEIRGPVSSNDNHCCIRACVNGAAIRLQAFAQKNTTPQCP